MDNWFPASLLEDKDASWWAVIDVGPGEKVEWRRLACDPQRWQTSSGWFIPGPDYQYPNE